MKSLFQILTKLVILACIVVGVALIVRNLPETKPPQEEPATQVELSNPKAQALRKHLLAYNKPVRVEIINLTQRFSNDVEEIKKMTLPLNQEGKFYVRIQFFTDETDPEAPLVAQMRFLDIKSDNLLKEESINLD